MPEADDAQSRRERGSSSVIINAFRNLTTNRRFVLLSPAPSITPSLASTQDIKNGDSVAGDKAVDMPLTLATPAPDEILFRATDVYGAPPALVQLLTQLQADQPLAVRAQAVYKICRYLDKNPVNEVLAIWLLGKDLPSHESADAAQYGFELLISCIHAAQLTTTERKLFWESIFTYTKSDHADLRFDAAIQLSDNGRNIECMEGEIAQYISDMLKLGYTSAAASRKKSKSAPEANSAAEAFLKQVFVFVLNVVKFNSTTLSNADFRTIIARVQSICNKTSTISDVSSSLELISHLATFTNVSATVFQPCLDLLCGIYKQVASLKETAWAVWRRIFESNLKSPAIVYLFALLREASTTAKKETTVHGAFHVLKDLAINDGKDGLPNIQLADLAPVVNALLKSSTTFNMEMDVLKFYSIILAEPKFRARLIDDVDWMYFRESLTQCSNFIRQRDRSDIPKSPGSRPQTPKLKAVDIGHAQAAQVLNDIVQYLCDCFQELNVIHQEEAATLFLCLGSSLNDNAARVLLEYFASRPFLTARPLEDYHRIWRTSVVQYAQDMTRPSFIRVQAYAHMAKRFEEIQYLPEAIVEDFVVLMIADLDKDEDLEALEIIASFAGRVLTSHHREPLFEKVLNKVRAAIFYRHRRNSPLQSRRPSTSPAAISFTAAEISASRIVVRHMIRLFLKLINEAAGHAEELYQLIIDVAGEGTIDADARICALKLLFRLRSTADHRLYVAAQSESESIAEILCRTTGTAPLSHLEETAEFNNSSRSVSTSSMPTSKSKFSTSRRIVPPLWLYPGPKALPTEPPKEPSLVLFVGPPLASSDPSKTVVLKVALWLEMVLTILQQPNVDWEVYSYVLVHLGAQLKNQTFFTMAIPHVKMLRSVICDQLRAQTFLEPPIHTSLKKADVAVCLYHSLTMLISYNGHFAKSEEDDLVRAFLLGIAFWDATSKWCIHALSLCCHELPSSVRKSLDGIVQKMSTIITRPGIAIHILEFLCGVARLPEMYQNFTEDEYKTVFGVAFKYLQFVQDQQQKQTVQRSAMLSKTKRTSDAVRDFRHQSSDGNLRGKSSQSEELPQYVHALAYHVITFWFMALKLRDRPQHVQQILKNLTYKDVNGQNAIEEQGLVTLDMMERVTYTDRDETMEMHDFATTTDGDISEKTWIVGLSLLTIKTAGRTGLSQIIRRRPSGTHYSVYRPVLTAPPRHQVPLTTGLEADAFYTSSYTGVLPENILQDFYAPLALAWAPQPLREIPFILPDNDDKIRRALASFDRNSTVDGHKIGVIYMANGQDREVDILANTFGSPGYTRFVEALGTLVRLKDATFNTGGLDRHDDSDGKYAYCWRDRSTELVWHVTTMMPTDVEQDAQCINKKRHIGNDYVNIIWNESGQAFKFDTFPSQFNYVYIVITPEPAVTFTSHRRYAADYASTEALASPSPVTSTFESSGTAPSSTIYYRVQLLSAPGFPSISPAAETKMISAHALAPFIRLLALNASYFSQVWAARDGGEIISPWRNRLREILRLRERYGVTAGSSDTLLSVANSGGALNHGSRPGTSVGGGMGGNASSSSASGPGGFLGTASGRSGTQRSNFASD